MFRRLFRRVKKEEGFTLVELMTVIVIIGILVAVAVPLYSSSQAKAEANACKANLRIIDGAISQYLAVHGQTPEQNMADPADDNLGAPEPGRELDDKHPLVAEGFLQKEPECPTAHAHYKIVYDATAKKLYAKCPNNPPHTYP